MAQYIDTYSAQDAIREDNTKLHVPTRPLIKIPDRCTVLHCNQTPTHMIGVSGLCQEHVLQVLESAILVKVCI